MSDEMIMVLAKHRPLTLGAFNNIFERYFGEEENLDGECVLDLE